MAVLAGYTLLGQLGSGTSGTVWKARDDTLDRVVAIKAVDAPTAESRAQWRNEAQVLAALDDPHLVAVYGYAEDGDGAYIVEEWIDGVPLPAVLEAGALSAAQALGVIRGALLGLSHVHKRGLVHGDIAPTNILLDTEGTSKLVDFGLSTSAGTSSGSGSGTAAYASPEVQRGEPVTAASDVYAAAAVLAYLLRGRAAAAPILGDIDPTVRPVLARALTADPGRRYPDAATFLAALEAEATRRYGAAWWTQTGMAALVAAAPAILLIDLNATAGTAIAGHGAGSVTASPSPGGEHVLEPAQPVTGHAMQPAAAVDEAPLLSINARPADTLAARRPRIPHPRTVAVAVAVVAVVASASVAYAVTRPSHHKSKTTAVAGGAGGVSTGASGARASGSGPLTSVPITHGTASIAFRLVHHCATCRNFAPAGTLTLASLRPESKFYSDGTLSASSTDSNSQNSMSISGSQIKAGSFAYQKGSVAAADAPSFQMSVLIPLTDGRGFQNEDASSQSLGGGRPATASCDMVLTQADGRTLSGTITCPSVNETISGGGEDTDIIYALTGTFTFSA